MSKDRVGQIVEDLTERLLDDTRFNAYYEEAKGLADAVGDSIREALKASEKSATDDLVLAKIKSMLDENWLDNVAEYFKKEAPAKGFSGYLFGIGHEAMQKQFSSSELCTKFENTLTENLSEPIAKPAVAAAPKLTPKPLARPRVATAAAAAPVASRPAADPSRKSSQRTVVQDYWYTNAHIEDLGTQWQRAASNRLFVPISPPGEFAEELTYKTGLTKRNVDAIVAPCKIMLPLNKGGNHWTAITADVTIAANGKKTVKLNFTDSLGTERNYDALPARIKTEMSRIGGLFGRDATVTTELYPHTWKQPDGSSCGPYSFANAARCLDGKGAEPNPGREVIRKRQLDVMTSNTAIKSCSTNNKVDEIIRDWVIDRMSKNLPYAINNHEEFMQMCQHFATHNLPQTSEDVRMIFVTENNGRAHVVLPYVQQRMGELIASDELSSEVRAATKETDINVKIAAARKEMKSGNSMQKFEQMRKEISVELGGKESYKFVAEVMQHLSQMHIEEAVMKISKLENPELVDHCLKVVSEVTSVRGIEKGYADKIEAQAEAYLATYEEEVQVEKAIKASLADSRTPAAPTASAEAAPAVQDDTPVTILEKHKRLLEQAIRRNDANPVLKVCYAIKDATAKLVSAITGGIWKPDYKLIKELERELSLPAKTPDLSKEDRKGFINAELSRIKRNLELNKSPGRDALAPFLPKGNSDRRSR